MRLAGDMDLTEYTWSTKDIDAQSAIWTLREAWRLGGHGAAGLDPGVHGALSFQAKREGTQIHPLGDERFGGLGQAVALAVRYDVRVIIVETQYVPHGHPNMPEKVRYSKTASAMKTARSAGMVIGAIAASVPRLSVVHVQPGGGWQDWVLDLDARATSDERKEAMLIEATRRAPEQMKRIPRAEDREGGADSFGLLTWWCTHPMRPSPLR